MENNLDNFYSFDDGGIGGGLDYSGKDGYVEPVFDPVYNPVYPVDPIPKEPVYPLPVDDTVLVDTDGDIPGDLKPINIGDYIQLPPVQVGIDEGTIAKIVGLFCLIVITVVVFVAKPFKKFR